VLTAIGAIAIWPTWKKYYTGDQVDDPNEPRIAVESEYIDFNSENGLLYVNNEVIIVTYEGTSRSDIETLAQDFKAELVSAMEEIGFWQLRFTEPMSFEELETVLKKIKKNDIVEDAYINTVYEGEGDNFLILENDGGGASSVEEKEPDPVYPDDPWKGDAKEWNVDVPRGSNWGMEAIRAPYAWGYLEQMTTINVGIIDDMVSPNHEDIDLAGAYITLTEEFSRTYSAMNLTPQDHGTHVAGIMAGVFDNGTGVSGVMGNKAILYYSCAYYIENEKVVNDYYTAYNYLKAIQALVERDVKVINISQNTSRLIGFAASRGNSNAINHLKNAADMAGKGLQKMIDKGYEFVICVAAGNSNNTYYFKDDKATYGYKESITWPWELVNMTKGGAEAKYNNFLNLIEKDDVKDRIIVVGSVGINIFKSKKSETRYKYSKFSCIGERVDVVAPGENVYSSVVDGYKSFDGTSMATPHVAGVAGLIFASNPNLTGAEVKSIILASTSGRFYYDGGYSGMIDAEQAVKKALQTKTTSVSRVVKKDLSSGLDLCFVVDTTASMDDDIQNAKDNMNSIIEEISAKNENFRVALIDYRDFPDRSSSGDYEAKLQLDFTENTEVIKAAINALDLGDGGDNEETVYSALMKTLELNWRRDSKKVIILLGDAAPLDPEPYTGYTLESVVEALYNADISLVTDQKVSVEVPEYEKSIALSVGDAADSLINVYTIGTNASWAAEEAFSAISEYTGGSYTGVESVSDVSEAIISTIEQIEIIPTVSVRVSFGEQYSRETVELYNDEQHLFEFELDEYGEAKIEDMEPGEYSWTMPRLMLSGTIKVKDNSKNTRLDFDKAPWYSFAVILWQRERVLVITCGVAGLIGLIVLIVVIRKLVRFIKNKAGKANKPEDTDKTDITARSRQQDSPVQASISEHAAGLELQANQAPVSTSGQAYKPETTAKQEQAGTPLAAVKSEDIKSGQAAVVACKCPSCGAEYDRKVNFCVKCGTKIQ